MQDSFILVCSRRTHGVSDVSSFLFTSISGLSLVSFSHAFPFRIFLIIFWLFMSTFGLELLRLRISRGLFFLKPSLPRLILGLLNLRRLYVLLLLLFSLSRASAFFSKHTWSDISDTITLVSLIFWSQFRHFSRAHIIPVRFSNSIVDLIPFDITWFWSFLLLL